MEVFLNLPETIFSIYTADITQCYENIPLQGEFGLINILLKLCKMVYNKRQSLGFTKIFLSQDELKQ